MKSSHLEYPVGFFVLLGLTAISWLAIKVGAGSLLGGPTYVIEARFANAGGLNPGSNVMCAGVTVGRVESLRMDSKDFSAVATLRVMEGLLLPMDTMASIKTTGLIGDKYISLAPGAEEEFLKPGAQITMTESSVDLESLIGKMAFGSVNSDTKTKANETGTPPTP
jgi:phospholipid/cholesterol/gamma-HCH transport system substrate-binding protein